MAATTRTITDTIYKLDGTPWEGATVRIDRVDRPMIDSDGTIGDSVVTGTTDASGDVSLTVAVPPSGAGRYRLTRPVESGQPVDVTYFYLAAGDAISVGEILAASASALSEDAVLTLLSAYLSKANNLDDLASAATARANLGLGTAATAATGDFEADLGNPDADGYVLSSTTGGTRSWVASAADVDDLTTTTGGSTDMLRVAAAGGLEYRTTAQVLADIGAAPTASPTFTGTVTLPTTVASVIKPASDSTAALQLTNAAGAAVLTVDTTNKRVGIGVSSPTTGLHVANGGIRVGGETGPTFQNSANNGFLSAGNSGNLYFTGTNIIFRNTTAVEKIYITDNGYFGVGNATPTAYADIAASTTAAASLRIRSGTAPTTPNAGDIWNDGTDFNLYGGGLKLHTGVIKPASDSTTALQLANAAGTAVLTVDTTNQAIVLATTSATPVAINRSGGSVHYVSMTNASGTVYFGSRLNKFFIQSSTAIQFEGSGGTVSLYHENARTRFGDGTAPTAYADIAASTTAAASLRIRSGTAPTTPNVGDIWFDGTNLMMYDGTTTRTISWT